MRFFFWLYVGVVAPFLSVAHAASSPDLMVWPAGGATSVNYAFVEETGDGAVFERLLLRGHEMDLAMRLPTDWIVVREAPSRVSFALRHSIRPDLVLTVTRFAPGSFFPDLSERTWNAYKEGLYASYGDSVEILEEPHNLAPGQGTVLLGEPNRAILFRLTGGEVPELRLKFFVLYSESPLVFTLSGPEMLVDANRSSVEMLLSRISPWR